MPEGFADPCIYHETGVLRNLVGATSYEELANAEGELVPSRASEFFEAGPRYVTFACGEMGREALGGEPVLSPRSCRSSQITMDIYAHMNMDAKKEAVAAVSGVF